MQLIHQPLYKYIWLWKFEGMMILRQRSYEIVINVYVRAHTAWIHKFSAEQMYQYDQEINPNLANNRLSLVSPISFFLLWVCQQTKKRKFPFCLVILTISYTCMKIELGFEHSWFYFMSLFHCSSVVETYFIMESYDTPIQIILL